MLEEFKTRLELVWLCMKIGAAVFFMVWLVTGNWDKLLDIFA
ncbi:hypothetical protein [Photobacterium sp. BZF1]|nr:hypothetical protein [Photobacterium sp. BZF1]